MKTSHISHVVLYAKNFYRHTGDVVKDMQRFMQLDGHPFWSIKTPEKVAKVMIADYIEWVNSLPEDFHHESKERLLKEANETVSWDDGVAGHIYRLLIIYSNYIPMVGSIMGYPIYDKYHLPQFNVKEHLFNENMSYDEMTKVAKDFLDETQESRYDRFMNNLLEKYDFEKVANIFNLLGDPVTAKELEDEMWDGYTEFMDEHSCEDGTMDSGYFDKFTKHFDLHFSTEDYRIDITAEVIFNTKTYIINKEFSDDAADEIFSIASTDTEFITDIIKSGNAINKVFASDGQWQHENEIDENRLTFDSISNTFISMTQSLKEEHTKKYLEKKKSTWFGTGYCKYLIKIIDEKSFALQIIFEHVFACSIMESELWCGGCFDDKKY